MVASSPIFTLTPSISPKYVPFPILYLYFENPPSLFSMIPLCMCVGTPTEA